MMCHVQLVTSRTRCSCSVLLTLFSFENMLTFAMFTPLNHRIVNNIPRLSTNTPAAIVRNNWRFPGFFYYFYTLSAMECKISKSWKKRGKPQIFRTTAASKMQAVAVDKTIRPFSGPHIRFEKLPSLYYNTCSKLPCALIASLKAVYRHI